VYAAVLLGPWGALKSAAYSIGSANWLVYALAFLVFVLGVIPGVFYLAVRLGEILAGSKIQTRRDFIAYAYGLVPLGLTAWIAFSLTFVFANLSYLWPVLSDPFGWGWNLVGTAGVGWQPYLTQFVPPLQVGILLVGLVWASLSTRRIALESLPDPRSTRQSLPVIVFCLAATLGLMALLIG
jgi:hypothetical protein